MCESGIYQIVCSATGRRYVGSAQNVGLRFRAHISKLNRSAHHSPKLQNAWNKYGETAFSFMVLEHVSDRESLLKREQFWIDEHRAATEGYNCRPTAEWRPCLKHSPETRAKISAAQRGKKLSAEHRLAISLGNIGITRSSVPFTAERRMKISLALTGKKRSQEICRAMSERRRGKLHSEATKEKMRASQKARFAKPLPAQQES